MADTGADSEQTGSFGAGAVAYAVARPSYPPEAVEWLIPPEARWVVDLGAGSGQLTGALHDRGLDVVAVEPSEGMRREFRRMLPDVTVLAGSAERIPLSDNSVDAAMVAQAWHWVDAERAVPELARVLRHGGQLGLVWNIRDEREDWVAQLGRIMHRRIEQDINSERPAIGAPFGPIERLDVSWTHHLSRSALLDLVASRRYVITMEPEARARVLAEIGELLDTHPALAGGDDIALPYVARCTRTRLD